MTDQDAAKRAEELGVGERIVFMHQHMHYRGYQHKNCPACRGLVQAIDAAVAEAVKERDEYWLKEIETERRIARHQREAVAVEARREEREHCIDVCESIGAGYVGTGQAVAKQIAQTLRRPPASAPEWEHDGS